MGRWEEASSDLSESQKGAKLGEGVRADVEGPSETERFSGDGDSPWGGDKGKREEGARVGG